ncbi:juvenile hormone epoxide hydrolase 1-like [Euwallacea similis]|uniref:juvenile hormone epoxide hydrolase 1-like n=1 Tax=Euwallacea similis TaxID=1736056 RepID=UPI00344EBF37
MGLFLQGLIGLLALTVGYVIYEKFNNVPEVPSFPDTWWGKGDPSKEETAIKPFKIDVSKEILDDLKYRLDNAIPLQPSLEGVQQNYGINSKLLQTVIDYWKKDYNWTERQKFLNKFPQYTVSVQGLKIHYIHVKPKLSPQSKVKVLPLLLLHGWPGSVREFYDIIPLLTEPQKGRNIVFEVIVPHLPGYGFSEATSKPGLSVVRISQIMKNLMHRIGFKKFYVQGGDWGSAVVMFMSILYPEVLLGAHSNSCFCMMQSCQLKMFLLGSTFPSLIANKEEIPFFTPILDKMVFSTLLESGYMHIQSTKPDTVGTALRDSPVGLAAYLVEKFTSWTNPAWRDLEDGGLTKRYTYENILDNVMIYWVTRSITTSQRIYAETFNKAVMGSGILEIPSTVPTACAVFKNDLLSYPSSLLKKQFTNLVKARYYTDGGHFAAFEVPDVLAEDVYDFIEQVEIL